MAKPGAVFEIDHPHDLSTYVLARLSGVNLGVYANFVASIMLRDFQLPIKGQRIITSALSNLPMFTASDERLIFGWAPGSTMRSTYVLLKGYEHACVLNALCGTFHIPYTVEVLAALARMTAGPSDMVPHLTQWRDMLRASCGSLISSDFDVLVEDFIRLYPYRVGPGSDAIRRRCRVPPTSMATALIALSKVTSRKQKQVVLLGGAVIAWFAALAEYFYDLNVTVKSGDGTIIHGKEINDTTQVVLFYRPEPDIEVLDKPVVPDQTKVMGGDNFAPSRHIQYLPFGGRVEWQALLPKVFGRAFHQLDHEQAKFLNTAIGAAARGLEGTTISSDVVDRADHTSDRANPKSYGIGLIQNITAWLPELQRGQGRMERQLKRSFEENAETYLDSFKSLQNACRCLICSTDDTSAQPKNGYCLSVIVETIVALGLAVSRMMVVSKVYPSREGVQGLYHSQVRKRQEAKHINPRSEDFFKIVFGNEWNAPDARRLQNAAELFTGTRPTKQIPPTLVGLAHEGLCIYMDRLQRSDRSNTIRPDNEGLIRVVSGAIYGKARIYSRVSTEPVISDEEEEDWAWEQMEFDHWSVPLYFR